MPQSPDEPSVEFLLALVAVLGLVLKSEVVFAGGAIGVLVCGLAWRWA
jgi:hypothetical protein